MGGLGPVFIGRLVKMRRPCTTRQQLCRRVPARHSTRPPTPSSRRTRLPRTMTGSVPVLIGTISTTAHLEELGTCVSALRNAGGLHIDDEALAADGATALGHTSETLYSTPKSPIWMKSHKCAFDK